MPQNSDPIQNMPLGIYCSKEFVHGKDGLLLQAPCLLFQPVWFSTIQTQGRSPLPVCGFQCVKCQQTIMAVAGVNPAPNRLYTFSEILPILDSKRVVKPGPLVLPPFPGLAGQPMFVPSTHCCDAVYMTKEGARCCACGYTYHIRPEFQVLTKNLPETLVPIASIFFGLKTYVRPTNILVPSSPLQDTMVSCVPPPPPPPPPSTQFQSLPSKPANKSATSKATKKSATPKPTKKYATSKATKKSANSKPANKSATSKATKKSVAEKPLTTNSAENTSQNLLTLLKAPKNVPVPPSLHPPKAPDFHTVKWPKKKQPPRTSYAKMASKPVLKVAKKIVSTPIVKSKPVVKKIIPSNTSSKKHKHKTSTSKTFRFRQKDETDEWIFVSKKASSYMNPVTSTKVTSMKPATSTNATVIKPATTKTLVQKKMCPIQMRTEKSDATICKKQRRLKKKKKKAKSKKHKQRDEVNALSLDNFRKILEEMGNNVDYTQKDVSEEIEQQIETFRRKWILRRTFQVETIPPRHG